MTGNRILVVGGGMAGLAAARDLDAGGADVGVLEAASSVAGRAGQLEVDGFRFDCGAEFFTSFYPCIARLIDEVGLSGDAVEVHGPGALFKDGRLVPMITGPVSALTSPLLSIGTKFRLRKLAGALLGGLDFSDPRTLAGCDDESAGAYARRTFGDEFTDICMKPGLESLTLSPIDRTSKAIFLAQAQEGPTARFHSLAGGMGRLAEALALAVDVEVGCRVAAIRPADDGVEVEVAGEDGPRRADGVVLAVPAPIAAEILAGVAPPDLAEFLASVEYTPAIKLHLGLAGPLDLGYPGVIPVGDGFADVAGLQFLAHKGTGQAPPGRDGLGVVVGGERARELLGRDDESIALELTAIARRILGRLPEILCSRVGRMPLAVPNFPPGRFRRLVDLDPGCGDRVALAGDYLVGPSLEGAARSGQSAAARLRSGPWFRGASASGT